MKCWSSLAWVRVYSNSRSVEFAKRYNVPIHVRHSFSDQTGTRVAVDPETSNQAVGGAALTKNEALVTVKGVPDRPGTSLAIFSEIAQEHIIVDMIIQNVGADGKANISFTVLDDDLATTRGAIERALVELGSGHIESSTGVAKISVVGLGMAEQTGVADRMFRTLASAGINILMITTSEIKISVLVDREQAQEALRTIHAAFELDKAPTTTVLSETERRRDSDALAVFTDLAGMEGLRVDRVLLDANQARITISQIPDKPGIAARVFEKVAAEGIFVDMIVQSYSSGGRADLSFTATRENSGGFGSCRQAACRGNGMW